jgi:thymidylate kinase
LIVCLCGGDAVGKNTQSKLLAAQLKAAHFAFPNYETPAGKAVLSNLKGEWIVERGDSFGGDIEPTDINALVLQSLMLVNRMEMGAELRAAAAKGHVVLDRFSASSTVYGSLDGLDPVWIEKVNAELPVQPDVFVLLDAPVEEGFKRRPERRDRYEKDAEFLGKVRTEYLRLFQEKKAEWQEFRVDIGGTDDALERTMLKVRFVAMPRWEIVDAVGTVEEVQQRIWSAIGGWNFETKKGTVP